VLVLVLMLPLHLLWLSLLLPLLPTFLHVDCTSLRVHRARCTAFGGQLPLGLALEHGQLYCFTTLLLSIIIRIRTITKQHDSCTIATRPSPIPLLTYCLAAAAVLPIHAI
jgi:hypothetical protein